MTKYAAGTDVPIDRSQTEIGRTLKRYGVDEYTFGQGRGKAHVAFVAHDRQVRFVIPLPNPADKQFTLTPTARRERSASAAKQAYDQAERQRWRALNLLIKAKLEAVEAGVQAFEDEFLPYTVLPDGTTVADTMREPVAHALRTGAFPHIPQTAPRAIGP